MVKLLMLITSLAGGGAEKAASELSLHLSNKIQRRIVTLLSNISYPANESPISMNFVTKRPKILSIIYIFIVGIIKYKLILKKYKPEISMSFLVLDNFINILSNVGNRKTKKVISVHIALSMKFRNSLLDVLAKKLIRILYEKADLIIAVSDGVKQELINDFNMDENKIIILYNPVNIRNIQKLSKNEVTDEQWFNEKAPIIITVGRLSKQKGQWHLIRAFSEVVKRKQCKLIIRGDGELKSSLERLVGNLNLINEVKFLGWKENPYKYISKSSVFVSASLWEALPYALTEAMACGCPVIATDCKYGPREILGNDDCGILIPPMDGNFYKASDPLSPEEKCLATVIIKFLEDDELRKKYSEKGTERAMEFDVEKCIKKYEEVMLSEPINR